MKLLIHTSKVKVDVLKPSKVDSDDPCICFSEDCFIPEFGQYIYIFEKEVLCRGFSVRPVPHPGRLRAMGSFPMTSRFCPRVDYEFESFPLEYEYRIYRPIDVNRLSIGVITTFPHSLRLIEKIQDEIIKEEIIRFGKE